MTGIHDLVALNALLEERSVSRAARRLGVTQSAMSHALARLRERFDDPLFVRAGHGLVPTARAEAMAPRLSLGLSELERAVTEAEPWSPLSAKRSFRLDITDYGELLLLPPLLARLAREAPGVDLRVTRAGDGSEALTRGDVELMVGVLGAGQPAGLRGRALFRDRFVCVMREGHPLADQPLTVERFAEARHALIAPRGTPGGIVDTALAKLGLERRVALTVPHFLAAPYIVAGSDLVLTLAERVARALAAHLPLLIVEPPLDLPTFTTSLFWHERLDLDPGHQWMRGLLVEVAPGEKGL